MKTKLLLGILVLDSLYRKDLIKCEHGQLYTRPFISLTLFVSVTYMAMYIVGHGASAIIKHFDPQL